MGILTVLVGCVYEYKLSFVLVVVGTSLVTQVKVKRVLYLLELSFFLIYASNF